MKIRKKVAETLVTAGSTFSEEKKAAFRRAIEQETNERSRWALEMILQNALIAEKQRSPLCDDTGIPHLLFELGGKCTLSAELLEEVYAGVAEGLRQLPGRPMAVLGDDSQRLSQCLGMDQDSGAVIPAPFALRKIEENVLRLHILMFGGGPAIRGKTYRVFHKHSEKTVLDEIVSWATESVELLGCSPCTLAIGIGRSHYEAASLMLQAQIDGKYGQQSDMEWEVTRRVNASDIGGLGLHGNISVLATFMKVGPQRASGIRVVCMRPCCCFEPRHASVILEEGCEEKKNG